MNFRAGKCVRDTVTRDTEGSGGGAYGLEVSIRSSTCRAREHERAIYSVERRHLDRV